MTAVQSPLNPITGTDPAPAIPGIGLGRLTVVELRKLVDTRAGAWLLGILALAATATVVIMLTAAPDNEQTFAGMFAFALLPVMVLLPVVGILSMTSEFSQRTAATTFALMPSRGRIITAKLAAAVLIAIGATVATGVIAAIGNLIAIALDASGAWHIDAAVLAQSLLLQVAYVLMGSAFGILLLNSPLAIVVYFVLPTVWSVLGEMVRWLHTAAGWLDTAVTSEPLSEVGVTGGEWARFATSLALWLLLPLILGTARLLHRDIT